MDARRAHLDGGGVEVVDGVPDRLGQEQRGLLGRRQDEARAGLCVCCVYVCASACASEWARVAEGAALRASHVTGVGACVPVSALQVGALVYKGRFS